jgi:hypothetical protein
MAFLGASLPLLRLANLDRAVTVRCVRTGQGSLRICPVVVLSDQLSRLAAM